MSWSDDFQLKQTRRSYSGNESKGEQRQNLTERSWEISEIPEEKEHTSTRKVDDNISGNAATKIAPIKSKRDFDIDSELKEADEDVENLRQLLADGDEVSTESITTRATRLNPHEVWKKALSQLEMQLPSSTFNTWVCDTYVQAYEDGEFIICSKNAFVRDWLQNRLRQMIKRTLSSIVGRQVQVQFTVCPPRVVDPKGVANTPLYTQPAQIAPAEIAPPMLSASQNLAEKKLEQEKTIAKLPASAKSQPTDTETAPISRQPYAQTGLKLGYTFDTFVVGKHNQLASAAAMSIVDKPGKRFNPLFVYGGVGLGKTHLLHAIGNKLYQRGFKTLYCTSEQFTNELISAIRSQSTDEFRNKYRELDLLLIDDIQFIGGKDSTQEEFFHTFNHLFNSGKQVVISSDKLPKAVSTLENRLRSRFEGGLQVDVSQPDFETRVAILEAKARDRHLDISLEVLKEIAGRVESNVRELEGTLNKLAIQAEIFHSHLDVGMARNILQDLTPERRPCSPDQTIEIVARHYRLTTDDIIGSRRTKEIAHARHITMYVLRVHHGLSLPVIGQQLGGRDHTTASHGIEKIEKQLAKDDHLRRELLLLREKIHNTH